MSKKELSKIREARDAATLTRASFSSNASKDAEIKGTIRLYMESWIIAPLNEVLAKYEVKP